MKIILAPVLKKQTDFLKGPGYFTQYAMQIATKRLASQNVIMHGLPITAFKNSITACWKTSSSKVLRALNKLVTNCGCFLKPPLYFVTLAEVYFLQLCLPSH